jgi:membrane-bound metal-dependent hydrolase YbcI (DUF457 family)
VEAGNAARVVEQGLSRKNLLFIVMDTVTHALLPVILAEVALKGQKRFGGRGLVLIGVAGALPDLLNPHVSLEARLQSWSHGLPFWAAFSICVMLAVFVSKQRLSPGLGFLICAAYLLHLICDAISGGINWLYPVSDFVWGKFWVHPVYWIPLDIFCLLTCYALFRMRTLWERRRKALQGRRME